ncbi:MAG: alpha/beta hydrolase [Chloroflexi bacterium]|nr:alpha/beta hydrolase [Chloroflexota bacterium]
MAQPLYEFGGAAHLPVLHLAVANGFPPQTYIPLLQPLTTQFRAVCLPPRALWPGEHKPGETGSWHDLAGDMLAGMEQYGLDRVVAVGHSFGGVASALAIMRQPKRFRALILLDPTFLPPRIIWAIRISRLIGLDGRSGLVAGALRRRARFASVDEAYGYFRGKRLFGDWPDASVRLYAEGMLRRAVEGEGFELAWPPAWEAHYFRTVYTGVWRVLPKLRGLLPTLVLRGGVTDTFVEESAAKLRRLLPEARHVEIPGHGHLFPQSAPDATRRAMLDWLREIEG